MTSYDAEQGPYETYGRLVAKKKVWGERDASSGELIPTYFKEL